MLISEFIEKLELVMEARGDISIKSLTIDFNSGNLVRTCTYCFKTKSLKEFHTGRPDCKECCAERQRENREKRKKIHTDEWYEKQIKDELVLKCKVCGETKPCYEFTINRVGKSGFHNHCQDCRPITGIRETKLKDWIK